MGLVEEARRLAPEIEAAAEEGERLRRLPDTSWKGMHEAGMFRALQPARWGGGEVPLREFVDAVIQVGRASGSASWVMGVVGVHPWQLALFSDEAQHDVWGADNARMHSSSYVPSGKAERVAGGFRITGRWSFSSGSDHCTAVNLGVMAGLKDLGGGLEVPDFRSMVLLEGDYTIDDNWHVAGMKGTGSKDIVVDGAFVPAHRTQSHVDYFMDRPLPGWELNTSPLYRLPWAVVFNFALAASIYGTALGFIDRWVEESKKRTTRLGPMKEDPLVQERLSKAMWDVDAVTLKLHRDCDMMWEAAVAGEFLSKEERASMRWNVNRGSEIVGQAVNELMHVASGRSIFTDHPLNRFYQDVQGGLGHAFLATDSFARTVGAMRMGGTPVEMAL